MTFLWRAGDERHAEHERRAREAARIVRIERKPDGTVMIFMPILQKLADPFNTCLCPKCLLPELQDQG